MVVKIPIELESSESSEIRSLLEEIRKGEQSLDRIRSETNRTAVGSPTPNLGGGDRDAANLLRSEGLGIADNTTRTSRSPLGIREGNRLSPIGTPLNAGAEVALPRGAQNQEIVSGAGSAPGDLVRQNQFNALQDQVQGIDEQIQSGLGVAGQAAGIATLFAKNPMDAINKQLASAGKVLGPVAAALFAVQITEMVLTEMQKPGGILDRRFKRLIHEEYNILRDREDKGQIRAGLKSIRVSQSPIGVKLQSGNLLGNTLNAAAAGNRRQNQQELEFGGIGV